MGFSGMSIGSLLLIFGMVVLLFGTKKLRTLGRDLGAAVNGFRKALKEEDAPTAPKNTQHYSDSNSEKK